LITGQFNNVDALVEDIEGHRRSGYYNYVKHGENPRQFNNVPKFGRVQHHGQNPRYAKDADARLTAGAKRSFHQVLLRRSTTLFTSSHVKLAKT